MKGYQKLVTILLATLLVAGVAAATPNWQSPYYRMPFGQYKRASYSTYGGGAIYNSSVYSNLIRRNMSARSYAGENMNQMTGSMLPHGTVIEPGMMAGARASAMSSAQVAGKLAGLQTWKYTGLSCRQGTDITVQVGRNSCVYGLRDNQRNQWDCLGFNSIECIGPHCPPQACGVGGLRV